MAQLLPLLRFLQAAAHRASKPAELQTPPTPSDPSSAEAATTAQAAEASQVVASSGDLSASAIQAAFAAEATRAAAAAAAEAGLGVTGAQLAPVAVAERGPGAEEGSGESEDEEEMDEDEDEEEDMDEDLDIVATAGVALNSAILHKPSFVFLFIFALHSCLGAVLLFVALLPATTPLTVHAYSLVSPVSLCAYSMAQLCNTMQSDSHLQSLCRRRRAGPCPGAASSASDVHRQ